MPAHAQQAGASGPLAPAHRQRLQLGRVGGQSVLPYVLRTVAFQAGKFDSSGVNLL